ncbi:MAG: hypothetical protein R3Y36_04235, partial [Spirochaetales bacterium]
KSRVTRCRTKASEFCANPYASISQNSVSTFGTEAKSTKNAQKKLKIDFRGILVSHVLKRGIELFSFIVYT